MQRRVWGHRQRHICMLDLKWWCGFVVAAFMVQSCGHRAGQGGRKSDNSTKRAMTAEAAEDDASPRRRPRPSMRRPKGRPPIYVLGPVLVRQILVDPETQTVLTEEGDTELCKNARQSWDSWMKCVDSRLALKESWYKKTRFKLRRRSVGQLKTIDEKTRHGKPFRRLLHFRKGKVIEAGNDRAAFVVHDLNKRISKSIPRSGMLMDESVKAAATLPDGRVLLVTVSGRRSPTARVWWWTESDRQLLKPQLTFRYRRKLFLGPLYRRMGMASRYLYVYCGSKDKVACAQIKQDGGLPYERCIQRDRSVALAVSRDGSQIALYIFGSLYLYSRSGATLSLTRRWIDIFYADKDSFFERPGLLWDDSGKRLALTSSTRLNLVVDSISGGVIQIRDHAKPTRFESFYKLAYRGAAFGSGSRAALVYGDLRGGLVRYDLETKKLRRWKLPEASGYDHELSQPDIVSYLKYAGNQLVAWRGGAVYVLDGRTMHLRGRFGTYVGLGWSRLLSNLEIP